MKAQVSRHLVPHALGLQDVPHAHVVHPRLVTVPQAVRCQPGAQLLNQFCSSIPPGKGGPSLAVWLVRRRAA
jgi:hypothetical protein